MQGNVPNFVLLLGFQMRSLRERLLCGAVMAAVILFAVYGFSLFATAAQTTPAELPHQPAAGIVTTTGSLVPFAAKTTRKPAIQTAAYEAQLHWAIPYVPRSPEDALLPITPGYRFVILDMSFRNLSSVNEIDMGLVSLTARLEDERGRAYYSDPLAIASLHQEYTFPQHEKQYKRMRGVLQPGDVFRTTIFAFEVPLDVHHFFLIMDDGNIKNGKSQRLAFKVK